MSNSGSKSNGASEIVRRPTAFVNAPQAPASSMGSGGLPDIPTPLHDITTREVQTPSVVNIAGVSIPAAALQALVATSQALKPKPSAPPPHPTVAQVLTPIPLGFTMAYKQLQSPTPYGNQITAYRIYRNKTANSFSGATLWETRPHDNALSQQTVTVQDSSAGGGQSWNYFITAVDSTGQEGAPVAMQSGAVTSSNANPNVSQAFSANGTTVPLVVTQIPSASVTVTTKGNSVLVLWSVAIAFTSATACQVTFEIYKDGVAQGSTIVAINSASPTVMPVTITWIDITPTAASHTYAIFWVGSNTNANINNNGRLQVVELG